jgi:hypothetical protein
MEGEERAKCCQQRKGNPGDVRLAKSRTARLARHNVCYSDDIVVQKLG